MAKFYRSDLGKLVSNPVWKELKENAADLIEGLQNDLVELDPNTEGTQIARIQGKIWMARVLFDEWIEDIKKDIEEDEEASNG